MRGVGVRVCAGAFGTGPLAAVRTAVVAQARTRVLRADLFAIIVPCSGPAQVLGSLLSPGQALWRFWSSLGTNQPGVA